jgi:hypothetical protein
VDVDIRESYKKRIMIDINKEAEEYAHNWFNMHETNNFKALKQGFMAGVKSKHVQAKIIQAQIDVLGIIYSDNKTSDFNSPTFQDVKYEMNKLQQQLKQLENEIQ